MTDQIKASDEDIAFLTHMSVHLFATNPLRIHLAPALQELLSLRATLAAQEQSHRDILQSVGEEATRQIAERDERIAELDKAVETLGWQCDTHRARIAELEADLEKAKKLRGIEFL